MKATQRIHREYFRPVQRGNRKSCTHCGEKLAPGQSIWCCGQYLYAKWRNQFDCCMKCWPAWAAKLVAHERDRPDNCAIELVGYHGVKLPAWMVLHPVQELTHAH